MWGMWFLPAILGLPGVCALTYWVLTVFTHITHLLWTAGVCQFASAVGIAELVKDTLYFLPPLRLLLGIWYIPNALVASAVMLSYYTAIGTLWAERTGYLSPVFESSADPCLNIHPDTITGEYAALSDMFDAIHACALHLCNQKGATARSLSVVYCPF